MLIHYFIDHLLLYLDKMALKVIILSTLIVLVFVKQYPLYKQCDQRWAWEQMGTSFYSICDAGSLLSSLAMASPKDYNPLTLNQWLKVNGKYKGNTIYLTALDQIGLKYLSNYWINKTRSPTLTSRDTWMKGML